MSEAADPQRRAKPAKSGKPAQSNNAAKASKPAASKPTKPTKPTTSAAAPSRSPGKSTQPAVPAAMPTPVRVATILLGVIAALLLVNAALTLFGKEAILDQLLDAGSELSRAELNQQLVVNIGRDAALGVLNVLAVVLMLRRRPLGRWLGIICAALLLGLSIVTIVGVGGLPIYTMLLVVLTVAIIGSLFTRTAVDWLTQPAG